MKLPTSIRLQGYWWLPENEEHKITGVLECSREGELTLNVLGSFSEKLVDESHKIPVIHGFSERGKFITLLDCVFRDRHLHFPGIPESSIHAHQMLVGVHFHPSNPTKFTSISFHCEGLDEWLGVSGIRVSRDLECPSATIEYEPPGEITASIGSELQFLVGFSWTAPSAFGKVSEAKITQKAHIRIVSEEPLDLKDLIRLTYRLNNFLCLAIDEIVSLTEVKVRSPSVTQEIKGKVYEPDIDVYYSSQPQSSIELKVKPHHMLFQYQHISDRLDEVLILWLAKYEFLEPVFNLYFAAVSNRNLYLENRFLALIPGLETLHRRTNKKTVMPEEEFKACVTAVMSAVNGNRQDWLMSRLEYANEPSLRARLKDLITPFKSFLGNSERRKALIDKTVNTRNYLTHWDSSLQHKSASGHELLVLTQKLRALFELQFLHQLGFPEETIGTLVNDSHRLKRALFQI
jgi:hypothetical protein